MADLRAGAIAAQTPGHVEQAAHIPGEQKLGACGLNVSRLVRHHAGGDGGVLNAERAAKAAAQLGLGHFLQREAGDAGEQRAGLGFYPKLAQAGTGIVIGSAGGWQRRRGGREVQHVPQEGGQFESFRRKGVGLGAQVGVVVKQMRHVPGEHAGAGAGGGDNVVVGQEGIEQAEGEIPRGGMVSGVIGGLATAGLRAGNLDRATRLFQQRNGGEADAGTVQVDQTGDKKGDAGGVPHEDGVGLGRRTKSWPG